MHFLLKNVYYPLKDLMSTIKIVQNADWVWEGLLHYVWIFTETTNIWCITAQQLCEWNTL